MLRYTHLAVIPISVPGGCAVASRPAVHTGPGGKRARRRLNALFPTQDLPSTDLCPARPVHRSLTRPQSVPDPTI